MTVRRRGRDLAAVLVGTAVTAGAAVLVAPGTVGRVERAVFRTVNGWPDVLQWPLWVFQTLGVLGMPLVVAAVALVLRHWRAALALVLLVPLKLGVERRLLKVLVHRERPGTTIPDAVLRDVPSAGLSFPSGHAVIAFGIVVLVAPYLRHRWQLAVLIALAVLNSVARVYLGGHAPLDVVGGAAAGVAVGGLLNLLVGIENAPRRRTGRELGVAIRISRGGWAALAAVIAAAILVIVLVLSLGGGSDPTADGGPATTPAPATTSAPTSSAAPTETEPAASSTVPAPTTTSAVPTVPVALLGQDLEVIPTERRVVALTFDAGGNSAGMASILQTLAREDVAATFFVTGDWATGDPAGLRAITAAGHRLGNHSMTHPHFPELSAAAIRDELIDTQEVLAAAGADPRPLFRFPFGDRDDATIGAVNDLGYLPVRWTVDTLGWQGTTEGRSAASVTERTMAALRPGAIVLMHVGAHPQDGSTLDADALPGLIDRLRAAGYGFVTLDALVA